MKSTINISLDTGIIAKLRQEKNYSDLINSELKAYYDAEKSENIVILRENLAETKRILKINNKRKREIDKKLEKINKKEKKVLKNFKIDREKLVTQIKKDRISKNRSGTFTRYYISPEDEADGILKGGREYNG